MCFGGGGGGKAPDPGAPVQEVDDASRAADVEQRKRLLLAKGLESTFTRSSMNSGASAGKSGNLGGTK
jgi:hypothetical protein